MSQDTQHIIDLFLSEVAQRPEEMEATSTPTDVEGVELHHLGRAVTWHQVQVSGWEQEPVSRLWTTWRGVGVAQEDMARGEDDIAELHRLSTRLIERTRVVMERDRLRQAEDRARLLGSLSFCAEMYARADFHEIRTAFTMIRLAHERCAVSRENLIAIIQQALDLRKNPRIFRGQAAESWSADVARRWVDEALRSELTDQDLVLLMDERGLPGENNGQGHVGPVEAVQQASAAATEALSRRDAAIRAAAQAGVTQMQIAAAAHLTQGRVSQLLRDEDRH